MNPRQRLARFERLRQLDQQKLERLAELARQAADRLGQARRRLAEAEEQFASELRAADRVPELADQLRVWERRTREELQVLQKLVEDALTAWESARLAVEQQQNRMKAWEKLLEQLNTQVQASELALESRLADEAYLQKKIRQRI